MRGYLIWIVRCIYYSTPDQKDTGLNLIESAICQRVKWMLEIRKQHNN